ncbi:MAG: hypothetical protein PHR30_10165 [Gallionellaceae bacterium]|nr:hypothetical protein [Gallionellaceae bacterium]
MKILGVIIIVALALLAVFTLANWSVLTAPTLLSFIVFEIQGPLGVILLGVTLVLVGLFAFYALSMRTAMLMEAYRHKQELQAQRKLAETAEASRLAELRAQMEHDFGQLRAAIEQTGGRIEAVEQALHKSFEEAANGLAAGIGEVEEKLDRILAAPPA